MTSVSSSKELKWTLNGEGPELDKKKLMIFSFEHGGLHFGFLCGTPLSCLKVKGRVVEGGGLKDFNDWTSWDLTRT